MSAIARQHQLTPFMIYCAENREFVQRSHPTSGPEQLGQILASGWAAISEAERKKYKDPQELHHKARLLVPVIVSQTTASHFGEPQINSAPPREVRDEPEETSGAATLTRQEKATREVRRKRKRDPNAPKAPSSAYMLFSKERRPIIRAKHPDAEFGDIGKLTGVEWKALSPAEKEPYERRSAQEKAKYYDDISKYKHQVQRNT